MTEEAGAGDAVAEEPPVRQLRLLADEPPLAVKGPDDGDRETARLAAAVGASIARWRRLRRLTQREVARRLGCDHSAVSYWEAGKRLPSLGHLVALARVLDCDARALLPSTLAWPDDATDSAAD